MRRVPAMVTGLGMSLILFTSSLASAQQQDESRLAADLRLQGDRLAHNCGEFALKKVIGCATGIITDHPFHMAIGSIAPQNGFGFGLAFVPPQWVPNDDWRISWSADAVGTPSGAWRGGAYAKFIRTRVVGPEVVGTGAGTSSSDALPRPYPTLTVYGQVTSLPRLAYLGLGDESVLADRVAFAMRQSTIGTQVFWPMGRSAFFNRLNPIAIGEFSGRWVHLAGSTDASVPSIETMYTDVTAPGLDAQPATMQFTEGLRIAPSLGRLQLTYTGTVQQFVAPSDQSASFRRWTLDLRHELSLWSTTRTGGAHEFNGPNECSTSVDRGVGEYRLPRSHAHHDQSGGFDRSARVGLPIGSLRRQSRAVLLSTHDRRFGY